jgi:hypothetical protein
MSPSRYRRAASADESADVPVPVVLPHVLITVTDGDELTVVVDGVPYLPPEFSGPWRRSSFGPILDALSDESRVPLRVEVREVDGSVFTDIITPHARRSRTARPADLPSASPVPPPPAAPAQEVPALVALEGEGFVPGEDVAVAIVVMHGEGGPTGRARGLVEADALGQSPTREVILLGRISGTVAIGHPE